MQNEDLSYTKRNQCPLVDRPLNAALLGACSTEMMQDYPLHV
jgi:hypothetical protein